MPASALPARIARLAPLALIPLSLLAPRLGAPPVLTFLLAGVAIVPLADWIRRATEQLAARAGLRHRRPAQRDLRQRRRADPRAVRAGRGQGAVVKATITGSIVGNSLLGLGLAIVVGQLGPGSGLPARAGRAPGQPADPLGGGALVPGAVRLHRAQPGPAPRLAAAWTRS